MEHKIPQPVNATERLLYGINIRLEALIDQLSAISEHLANKEGVAITNEVKQEIKQVVQETEKVVKQTRKGRKKDEV